MTFRIILLLTVVTAMSFGLVQDPYIKRIDKYKTDIDSKLKAKKLTSKEYPEMSFYGGSLTGYYLNKKLVLIQTQRAVEFAFTDIDLYIINDSVVYVTEQNSVIKQPENMGDYIEKHTDKNGLTDLSKLPLEVDNDNTYYLKDHKIVAAQMISFKKKVFPKEEVVAEKNRMILAYYRSFLEELNQVP